MNVLSVGYPLFPVSADSAGGAEQILFLLERGLVKAGHRSLVIAARGSRVSGELVETPPASGEITDAVREQAQQAHAACIQQVLEQFPVDLVHFHGLDFSNYLPAGPVATIATLHLPLAWYPPSVFSRQKIGGKPAISLCCVSESQARTAPDGLRLPVVPNGIEVERYRADAPRRPYLLWLGRVCEEKGTDIALRAAHRLGLPLMVAGPVHPFPYHQTYFSERVAPLLDEKRRYVGAVALEQKIELLAEARCVLIPSLAAETGSLVAMEAISSGAPVIAFDSGALPEMVEHGVTGLIVSSEEEMAEAVKRTGEISPARCREEALRRFDAARMVEGYINLYRQLYRHGRASG
ncbi:MAG TPA: glycosyltransferase [Bryobacteraceae bacterium]|jgi:glycosyltransferase involved in cell wall biosynthesis|nr:glycosyltransferase [Bryobacteraceae bacterium]